MSESPPIATLLLTVDAQEPEPAAIAQAAAVIRRGGLVAFPTETVYGVGANALDGQAVAGIFRAKRRPANDPIIVHLAAATQLSAIARAWPPIVARLAAEFWPGPLTLVLQRQDAVPPAVTSGLPTVAVRVPAHPVALALIQAAATPIAAPSANLFSRPSATSAAHVLADLHGRVDLILDAGPAPIGLESTILDLTSAQPVILRPGGVPLEALRRLLPDVVIHSRYLDEQHDRPNAPGMLLRHYAPQARLTLFDGAEPAAVRAALRDYAAQLRAAGQRVAILATAEEAADLRPAADELAILGPQDELPTVAHRLFDTLRQLDAAGVDAILVRAPEATGLGLAIRDRLLRAAEGRCVTIA